VRSRESYTVYAVFEDDNDQRYTAFVDALSPEDAEKRAIEKANSPIIIASVVKGYVYPVDRAGQDNVVPLRGRSYVTWVSQIAIAKTLCNVPFHCAKCRADFRKIDSLRQADYVMRTWGGRIPRRNAPSVEDRWGVVVNEDAGSLISVNKTAVRLVCACCGAVVWDGCSGCA
jgi:hypothetical protein